MLLFTDSFDGYSTSELASRWNWGGSGTWTIEAATGRNGTQCLRLSSGSSSAGTYISRSVPASQTIIVGFAIYVNTMPTGDVMAFSFWEDSTKHVVIRATSAGGFAAYRNTTLLGSTAAGLFTTNTWYYVEIKVTIHDTTGSVVMKVDGTTVLNLTNVDTRNGGAVGTINLLFPFSDGSGSTTTSFGATRIDDMVVMDTSGSSCNDFLGDVRVQARFPTGAGNYSQWTPVSGANYTNVDDNPPNNDTDYVASGTPGQKDSYTHEAISPLATTIHAIAVNMRARKDYGGTREIRALMRHSGTDATGAAKAVGTSYSYHQQIFHDVPGGTGWTQAQVNAAEAGVEVVT